MIESSSNNVGDRRADPRGRARDLVAKDRAWDELADPRDRLTKFFSGAQRVAERLHSVGGFFICVMYSAQESMTSTVLALVWSRFAVR